MLAGEVSSEEDEAGDAEEDEFDDAEEDEADGAEVDEADDAETVMRLESTVEPSWLQAKGIRSHSQRVVTTRKRAHNSTVGERPAKRCPPPRLKRHDRPQHQMKPPKPESFEFDVSEF